ncbi:MAG: hypothetical protein ABFS56_07725 [Pseudomonadota bacterium]
MIPQNSDNQASAKTEAEKPQYVKPEVIASYSEQALEKEFANVYGDSFVDLFGS